MNRSLILAPHEVRAALRGPVLIVRAYRLPNRETTQPASVHPDGSGLGWIAWWPKPVTAEETARLYPGDAGFPCPLGSPGDHLWVREAWGYRCSVWSVGAPIQQHHIRYRADDAERVFDRPAKDFSGLPRTRKRRADEDDWDWDIYLTEWWASWRSPVTLPRWASRLTVEVESVEVRRVQTITEEEAYETGAVPRPSRYGFRLWWEAKRSWEDWAWFVRVRPCVPPSARCEARG